VQACYPVLIAVGGLALAPAVALANTLPVASPDTAETHARAAVLIDLLANDEDVDGDALSVSITGLPTRGSVTDHGDGTVTYTPDPALFEGSGGDSFAYTVDDGQGGLVSAAVTVSELPVPPELQPIVETLLLEETFDDGDFAGWTVVDFGSGSSNWSAATGEMVQTTNICCDGRGRGTYAVYDGGTAWTDYRLRGTIRSTDDDAIGLVFRYQDGNNHYRFDWRKQQDLRRLMKVSGGTSVVIQQDSVPYESSDSYRLDIRAQGTTLEVLIDGKPIFSAQDTSFSSGTIALLSHGNVGSYFDDLVVTELPEPAEPLLLDESFDQASLDEWRIADWGVIDGPSQWSLSAGELTQSANIYLAEKEGPFGSHIVYPGGMSWTDYRIQALLRSGDDDSLGIVFRFQDAGNFYRFTWNQAESVRNLVKVVDGKTTFLAQDGVPYVLGDTYFVEIVARGPSLELWIDGKQIFGVTDVSLAGGTVGFTTEGNSAASYDDLRVIAIP